MFQHNFQVTTFFTTASDNTYINVTLLNYYVEDGDTDDNQQLELVSSSHSKQCVTFEDQATHQATLAETAVRQTAPFSSAEGTSSGQGQNFSKKGRRFTSRPWLV